MDFQIHIDRQGAQPVYLQIRDQLKAQIIRMGLQTGTRMPSVDMIAEYSKCSLRTADLAMQALVEDGICYRRPKKGTFVNEQKRTAVRSICGVWSNLQRQNFNQNILVSNLVQGVMAAIAGTPLDVTLLSGDPEETIRFYRTTQPFDFRGLLVVDRENFPRMLELARIFPDVRFVLLNYCIEIPDDCPENVSVIMNNDRLGAILMAKHCFGRGIRKIAFVTLNLPSEDMTYRERVNGFIAAAEANSPEFDAMRDILVCPKPVGDISKYGYAAIKQYMESGNSPDVICAVNDFLACGIERYLEEKGLSGKIQVAGYDMLNPDLAKNAGFDSVAVDYAAMSRTGVELLRRNGPVSARKIVIDPKLYIATKENFAVPQHTNKNNRKEK